MCAVAAAPLTLKPAICWVAVPLNVTTALAGVQGIVGEKLICVLVMPRHAVAVAPEPAPTGSVIVTVGTAVYVPPLVTRIEATRMVASAAAPEPAPPLNETVGAALYVPRVPTVTELTPTLVGDQGPWWPTKSARLITGVPSGYSASGRL